jgi:hypothetical protein
VAKIQARTLTTKKEVVQVVDVVEKDGCILELDQEEADFLCGLLGCMTSAELEYNQSKMLSSLYNLLDEQSVYRYPSAKNISPKLGFIRTKK